ncbi:hypothetical protein IFM89_025391 [Coptis chinensis]|uniref:Protein phosphatase n=1 Tax=Coptis chinensis TaxID=261450 RepID=A0A835H6W3_9MAGN|nr:hypothetical protein IFM89_025391 [Coptis chinensis]
MSESSTEEEDDIPDMSSLPCSSMNLMLHGAVFAESLPMSSERVISIDGWLQLISGSFYIPKESDNKPLGGDAHFICADEQTIGVADGVGGWAKKGIDSGEYARLLVSNLIFAIKCEPYDSVDPKKVLNLAYSNTKAQGSSTACIVTLKEKRLCAVNIGDSGFIVIRKEKKIYRSPIQQRHFNCPYQLGNSPGCDRPHSAQVLNFPVEAGDAIVVGTDGLFDNLFDLEIVEEVNKGIRDGLDPNEVAYIIAGIAWLRSYDNQPTPFAKQAKMAGKHCSGGKKDDISVIVAYIR